MDIHEYFGYPWTRGRPEYHRKFANIHASTSISMDIHASINSMDIHWNPWRVSPPISCGGGLQSGAWTLFCRGRYARDMRGICAACTLGASLVLKLGLYKGPPPPSVGNLWKSILYMDTFLGYTDTHGYNGYL